MRIPRDASILILASASQARQGLLQAAGFPFECVPSHVREIAGRGRRLRDVVLSNARRKALAVARRFPGRCVLGADTLIEFGGRLVGKPRTLAEAERLHVAMGGRWHRIATGVCLVRGREVRLLYAVSRVLVRRVEPQQLRRLYARRDPRGMAGGYAVERAHDPLIERVEGSITNVLGLPMEAVLPRLEAWGLARVAGRKAGHSRRPPQARSRRRRSPARSSGGPSPS